MSESHPLQETLSRLTSLLNERGRDRDDVLDPVELARATALPEDRVRDLLAGKDVPEDEVDERVVQRVAALFQTRLAETGKSRTKVIGEVAERLGISGEWARRLLNGEKVPNVKDLTYLEEYFEQEPGAFQITAADALNRALQPILRELEAGAGDPMTELMEHFNIVAVARRGAPATPQQQEMMAQFISAVLQSGPEGAR